MPARLTPESFYARATNPGPDSCWEWQGFINSGGYGRSSWEGKGGLAHRISFQIANGPIPAGLCVMHICDNPKCINPAHLKVGTHRENMQDSLQKGRLNRADRYNR